jgi:hypothetical protein
MPNALRIVRRFAKAAVVLAVLALPTGVTLVVVGLAEDVGDNALGDIITIVVGGSLIVFGAAGAILGAVLASLATRALTAPAKVHGTRRTLLRAGSAVLVAQVVAGLVIGNPVLIALIALPAGGYLIVAGASSSRAETVIGGALALALIALGFVALLAQLSQGTTAFR